MKRFLLCLLFALPLFAQQPVQIANPCFQFACFHASTSGSVAASASTTLTIQEPTASTGQRQVQFLAAVVQCATQTFTVGQAQAGVAATATAGTAVPLMPTASTTAAAATVWTASNVGAGTATAATLTYPAAGPQTIDLSMRSMSAQSANYSITLTNTGGASCTGAIDIFWYEKQ